MMDPQTDPLRPQKSDPDALDVIIFGSGACARHIAANLNASGISVCLVSGEGNIAAADTGHLPGSQVAASLDRCRGFAGSFDLVLRSDNGCIRTATRAIVVAEACRHTPNLLPYGLDAGPRVVDMTTLESMLASPESTPPFATADTVAFVCGWQADCPAVVAHRMLDACCQVQQRLDGNVYFMTGDLKVSAQGAQKRAWQAQQAGVVFLKFEDPFPSLTALNQQRFRIAGMDQLSGDAFHLDVDWIVVDDIIRPSHRLAAMAQVLGIDRDESGFAQSDNVRRMNNTTNRHGIFVAGGGRGVMSSMERLRDADQVSLELLAYLDALGETPPPAAVVQSGRCARCLTCHRLCPHLAIDIGPRIRIVPHACQRCGICMAGCPAQAIEMDDTQIDYSWEASRQRVSPARIAIIGCSRSAGHAFALTRLHGNGLPEGTRFVEVPCGGTIAARDILAAFESGADGVMLCPCHADNCHSQTGSQLARRRAAVARDLLQAAGINADRLRIAPLAANMGVEFVHMVKAFANQLHAGATDGADG